jgi:hypothetical protein
VSFIKGEAKVSFIRGEAKVSLAIGDPMVLFSVVDGNVLFRNEDGNVSFRIEAKLLDPFAIGILFTGIGIITPIVRITTIEYFFTRS